MSQKFEVLPGIDINLYNTAMYKSRRAREVDSKAFNAEHIISY